MKKLSFLILISITLNPIIYAQNTIPSTNSNSRTSTKNYPQLDTEVPTIPMPEGAFWQQTNDGKYNYNGNTQIEGIPYETTYTIDADGQISIAATSKDGKNSYTWDFFKNGNLKSVENINTLPDGKKQQKTWVWDARDLYDYSINKPPTYSSLAKISSENAKFSYYPEGIKPPISSMNFGPDQKNESIPYNSKNDPLRDVFITAFPEPKNGGQWDHSKNTYIVNNITIYDPYTNKPISSNFQVQFTYDANNHINKIIASDPKLAQTYTWNFGSDGTLLTYKKNYWYDGIQQTDTSGHYSGDIYKYKSTFRPDISFYERYPVGINGERNLNIFNYPLPEGSSQIKPENPLEPVKKTDPEQINIMKS